MGDDGRAKIDRAYAQRVPGPEGFRNPFVSPIPEVGDSHVYIAVLQFNHLYAACGYAGMDTIQSPFSSGAECRGVEGEICAEWEGLQVCPVALPFLEGKTRIDMAAEPVVHEFMHPFGLGGPDAHYGTEACNLAMGREPDYFDEAEGIFYNACARTCMTTLKIRTILSGFVLSSPRFAAQQCLQRTGEIKVRLSHSVWPADPLGPPAAEAGVRPIVVTTDMLPDKPTHRNIATYFWIAGERLPL